MKSSKAKEAADEGRRRETTAERAGGDPGSAPPPDDRPADALWRRHAEDDAEGAAETLLAAGRDGVDENDRRRAAARRFCLRGHELSGVRRGALRSSADEVVSDLLKFRNEEGGGAAVHGEAKLGERERLREAVIGTLSSRCVFVEDGGKLRGACGENGEAELSPEERKDTVLALQVGGGGKNSDSESPSSLVSKLASLSLGEGASKTTDAEAGGGDRLAAAAKYLGSALQSHLGSVGDDGEYEAGTAAARSIAGPDRDPSSAAASRAPSAGIAGRVLSGAAALGSFSYRLAAAAAGGAAGAASYAARTAGLVGEEDEYGAEDFCADVGMDGDGADDYGDADDGKKAGGVGGAGPLNERAEDDLVASNRAGTGRSGVMRDLGGADRAVSAAAAVRCCVAVLRHAESIIKSEEHRLDDSGDGPGRILLGRIDDSPRSFRQFCRSAGEAMLASADTEEEAAYGRAMSCLGPSDTNLLALILLSSGRAAVSRDGDVLALHPSGVPTSAAEALGEVDVALFKLRSASEGLEARMERLAKQAEAAATAAVRAKRAGASRAALGHVRRRKLLLEELDRCSATLLNLETATQSLGRARSDAQVLQCYEMATGAMKMVRAPEGEGGMGLTAERAEEVAEGLAEEMDELNMIGEAMTELGGTAIEFDEDELQKEFEALESEITLDAETVEEKKEASGTNQGGGSPLSRIGLDAGVVALDSKEENGVKKTGTESREEVSVQSTERLKISSE